MLVTVMIVIVMMMVVVVAAVMILLMAACQTAISESSFCLFALFCFHCDVWRSDLLMMDGVTKL
jgi:hypothetical protein